MGLDKLKKKKKPHQLVSKRKDGKRPGYYGPDAGHANDPGSSANDSGGGGGDGGGDDYMNYYSPPAQSYTPAPTFDYESEAYDTTPAASYSESDTSEDDSYNVQDDLTDFATNVMKAADPEGGFEDDDKGDSLYITKKPIVPYVSPTQTIKEEEPYYGYTPGPNYVTAQQLSNLERGLGDADQRAATLANIQAVNPIQQPTGILQTAGTTLKNRAIDFGLNYLTGGLYGRFKTPYTIAQAIDNRLLGDRVPRITQFAKNIPQGTGDRRPNTARGYESDGDRPIPKDVVTANVQKFSPKLSTEQLNRAILIRDKLQEVAEKGVSLNKENQMTLTALNNLIEQYQVSV